MALNYVFTFHVTPVESEGAFKIALGGVKTPLFYPILFAFSLGDTVDGPPSGSADPLGDQNDLLKAKFQDKWNQIPPSYLIGYQLDPDPQLHRPSSSGWVPNQPGLVYRIFPDPIDVTGGGVSLTESDSGQPSESTAEADKEVFIIGGQKFKFWIGIHTTDEVYAGETTVTPANEGGKAAGVQVFFEPTRTTIPGSVIDVRTACGERFGEEPKIRVVENRLVELRWSKTTIEPGTDVAIRIAFDGEPLVVERIRWIVTPKDAGGWKGKTDFVEDSRCLKENPLSGLEPSLTKDADRRWKLTEEAIEKRPETKVAHGFFYELDLQSTPPGAPPAAVQQFGKVSKILRHRTLSRARARQDRGVIAAPDVSQVDNLKSTIEFLGKLVEKHFLKEGSFDLGAFESAFEWFSNGELWVGESSQKSNSTPTGVPDSANYFLFAELALTALEMGVPQYKGVWLAALNVLVRTCDVYRRVYRGSDLLWDYYSFVEFNPGEQAATDFAAVKQKYAASKDLNNLRRDFACLAYQAFQVDIEGPKFRASLARQIQQALTR